MSSREYYELVRNALRDDGLVMQWNGGEPATEYKLLMRTGPGSFEALLTP